MSNSHDIAIVFFSIGEMIFDFFSIPPIILSIVSKKSCFSIFFLEFLKLLKADSLQTFAISAPENPGVCLKKNSCQYLYLILVVLNEPQKFPFFLLNLEDQHKFVYQTFQA